MQQEGCTVYCNTELEGGATKRVAQALVDCKVRVLFVVHYIMSTKYTHGLAL